METIVFVLQVIVALAFFLQKVLVLIDKKSGWLIGTLSAVTGVAYFYLIGLYCFAVLEIGLVVLMAYGFFIKKKNPKVEKVINITIILVMTALVFWAFAGIMTIAEFVSSVGLIFGTYWLTHNKARLGWLAYATAHVLAAVVGYNASQVFFADIQIASAIVTLTGAWKTK